jgi:hippurate hydrolase
MSQMNSLSLEWMRTIRRQLHSFPELAYQEENTAKLICDTLEQLQIPYQRYPDSTGIRAVLGKKAEHCIALRADMDALPVVEETGLSFASKKHGKMHACGHDGHVAMLLGAARILQKSALAGQVVLLFQPAEESGNGAASMIANGCLQDVAMIFCGHIDTHFPVGTLTVDTGVICSYTDPFTLTIKGQGGHAAKPHEAVDAIVAASSLIMNIQTLISRHINPVYPAVVTVGHLKAGSTHNVIAENALLEGTIRSGHPDTRHHIITGLKQLVDGAAKMSNTVITLRLHDGLPAVINDKASAAIAKQAAVQVAGGINVVSQQYPSLGGEDFSFYQQHVPGSMIRFGAEKIGAGPAHSGRFDFDEDVLTYGANWLATVARCGIRHLQQTGGDNG